VFESWSKAIQIILFSLEKLILITNRQNRKRKGKNQKRMKELKELYDFDPRWIVFMDVIKS